MQVASLPLEIIEAEISLNLGNVETALQHVHPDTDILVLPELFSTGFLKDEAAFQLMAEPMEGNTMSVLCELSRRKDLAIAGTFLCRDSATGTIRNRAFFINPDDDCHISYYDKHHLFTGSPEHRLMTPGIKEVPVITFRGWNIALCICFDIRFPVWCRNVGERYDMMIVPANWPDSRYEAWKHLLIARAIENVAVMVGVNRSGHDQFGTYSFLSTFAVNHRGTILAEIHGNTPIRHASFKLEEIREFRKKFPVFEVAERFNILSE